MRHFISIICFVTTSGSIFIHDFLSLKGILAAAAAKSLQSSPVPGILQARTLEWDPQSMLIRMCTKTALQLVCILCPEAEIFLRLLLPFVYCKIEISSREGYQTYFVQFGRTRSWDCLIQLPIANPGQVIILPKQLTLQAKFFWFMNSQMQVKRTVHFKNRIIALLRQEPL